MQICTTVAQKEAMCGLWCWVLPVTTLKPRKWSNSSGIVNVVSAAQHRGSSCRAIVIRGCAPITDDKIIKSITKAYDDDEDGVSAFLRVRHARENTSETLRRIHGSDLIYGDVDLKLALSAISRILRPGETFLDAGSGYGRVVLAVACKFPDVKCMGVEIVQALHEEAVEMKEVVKEIWEADGGGMGKCELICGDFRKVYEEEGMQADVVFAFCTTWHGAVEGFVEGMIPIVGRLKSGARVILVDGRLPSQVGEMLVVEEWMREEKNAATGSSTVRAYSVREKREK